MRKKKRGKRRCRVCRKPLPEKSQYNRALCGNTTGEKYPSGKLKLSDCQIVNQRRISARALGFGKLHEVQCEICLEFFMPDHPRQKVHKSEIPGEMSACEAERQRRFQEKYRDDNPKKSGYRFQKVSDGDLQLRACLGRLCQEESEYPGEKKFMSRGPYNRICERCQAAEERNPPGGRFVVNTEPGVLSNAAELVEI